MPQSIEYFYSAHSAYAYLGAWELERIAAQAGAQVVHRPFDFLPVVEAARSPAFKDRTAAHIDYFFGRELVRWAEIRGLPIMRVRPTHHDNPLGLANGAIIAAKRNQVQLSQALLQAHWRDDADLADTNTIARLADGCGLDGAALVAAAQSDAVQAQHKANTDEAIARTVFGSPTYFVGGDMFYGQDRLFMVEKALEQPFQV